MELFIHSQTSMVKPLEFKNALVISSYTLQGMWLLIHAGIKVLLQGDPDMKSPLLASSRVQVVAGIWAICNNPFPTDFSNPVNLLRDEHQKQCNEKCQPDDPAITKARKISKLDTEFIKLQMPSFRHI